MVIKAEDSQAQLVQLRNRRFGVVLYETLGAFWAEAVVLAEREKEAKVDREISIGVLVTLEPVVT